MNFIKSHKKLLILFIIILIAIMLILLLLKSFNIDYSKSEYGDRLNGIKSHEIKKETQKKLKEELESLNEVKKCEYRLQGRLINIKLTMTDGVNINDAKEISKKVLDYFSDDDKKFYDIQIFLKNENDKMEGYPKIGEKHKSIDSIVW